MSKYARTKDGIFELTGSWGFLNWTVEEIINNEKAYETVQPPHFVKGSDIIKEADTIEELCDEFVFIYNEKPNKNHKFREHLISIESDVVYFVDSMVIRSIKDSLEIGIIYGAIWTDKGLIYVAKMNEDGEFELI